MIYSMRDHSIWGWVTLLICTRLKMGIVEKFETEDLTIQFKGCYKVVLCSISRCQTRFLPSLPHCTPATLLQSSSFAVCEQQIPGLLLLLWLSTLSPCYSPTTKSLCGCSRDLSTGMDTNVHLAACTAGRAALSVMGSGQENTFCRLA